MDKRTYYDVRAWMFTGIAFANFIFLIIVSLIDIPVDIELGIDMFLIAIDIILFTAIFINLQMPTIKSTITLFKDLRKTFESW